jgi:CDP-diacylglycerol--glycerol-3-phosphate 3-phosphatidyltransferase
LQTESNRLKTKSEPDEKSQDASAARDRIVTIPNVICLARLIGSFSLFYLAWAGNIDWFVNVFVVLNVSDWIDGRLARWLNQRSDFGARLDSFADSVLYGAMLFGMVWLKSDVMLREAAWWIMALASYFVTISAGLWKYRRIPSYHTYGAKVTQCFVLLGIVFLMLDYTVWPFRVAAIAVTLTNLETLLMTWVLPKWRADVLSLWHALRLKSKGTVSQS